MEHHSIEQVKASVRLEDVVRQHGIVLHANQQGERLEGSCPFHLPDQTPSFNIYVTSQRYHCFGCGADGDVIDFVQAYESCSFQEALERLAGKRVTLPPAQRAQTRIQRPVLPILFPLLDAETSQSALLTSAQQHYHQTLVAATALQTMLHDVRGITEQGIRDSGLGYADGSFLQAGLTTPETRQHAYDIGLLSTTQRERLWQRLIIPECVNDHCTWMIGRSLYQPLTGTRNPKYLGLSLPKPLLGYGLALKRLRERSLIQAILVVEGALDYVIASQWNLPVVCVALIGTHASMRQVTMLLDLQQRANQVPLLISLDADEAGRQASQYLIAQLRQHTLSVGELPPLAEEVKDIGDLCMLAQGRTILGNALEQALSTLRQGEPS